MTAHSKDEGLALTDKERAEALETAAHLVKYCHPESPAVDYLLARALLSSSSAEGMRDALMDSQFLAGVTAGWNAAQADDPNAAKAALFQSRAGYLQPLTEHRGMREALRQLELNESELWGIRDDYIEAQHSGVHNGRRIKPEVARQYARDFGERADAAKQCTDVVRAALSARAGEDEQARAPRSASISTDTKGTTNG